MSNSNAEGWPGEPRQTELARPPVAPEITILNTMAGRDFESSLDRQVEWGLTLLDLKDSIFGKGVIELSKAEAERAARLMEERGLRAYCLSTNLFDDYVEEGEGVFREQHLKLVDRAIAVAEILQPKLIRLIAARTRRRSEVDDAIGLVRSRHPWLLEQYATAVEKIATAGFTATIENETSGCLLSTPAEVQGLFEALPDGAVCFTWDVVNLWHNGTFPTLEVYEELRPLLGYYHVKGGRTDQPGSQELRWKSSLEGASWPVAEITRQVVHDGASPVICINPPKGKQHPDEDASGRVKADLAFLRELIDEEYAK